MVEGGWYLMLCLPCTLKSQNTNISGVWEVMSLLLDI